MAGKALAAAAAAALTVFVAPATAADSGKWSVTGSGWGSGVVAGDHVELAAHSDAGGANPSGHGEVQTQPPYMPTNDGGEVVCVRVAGNRAVVVWRLREPQTTPDNPGFVGEFGAAYIEDNGPPVGGRPVDRMLDFSLRSSTAALFCNTDLGFSFAFLATPIESGNFVVNNN